MSETAHPVRDGVKAAGQVATFIVLWPLILVRQMIDPIKC